MPKKKQITKSEGTKAVKAVVPVTSQRTLGTLALDTAIRPIEVVKDKKSLTGKVIYRIEPPEEITAEKIFYKVGKGYVEIGAKEDGRREKRGKNFYVEFAKRSAFYQRIDDEDIQHGKTRVVYNKDVIEIRGQ